MKCEQVVSLLPEFLDRTLEANQLLAVQAHTIQCDACSKTMEELSQTMELVDSWPEEEPSPRLQERFYAMLEAETGVGKAAPPPQPQRRGSLHFWQPILTMAAAVVLLLTGVFVGKRLQEPKLPAIDPTELQAEGELVQMRNDLNDMARTVSLTLMRGENSGGRLHGVSYSYRVDTADPAIVKGLLHLVRFDASSQVRIAAIRALYRFRHDETVRTGLIEALEWQFDPEVQAVLIDSLTSLDAPEVAPGLEALLTRPGLAPKVRDKAERSLLTLR